MQPNKIVIHFKDGSLLNGNTNDFFHNKESFHLNQRDGKITKIDVENLKAVFFVKDHKGDNDYIYEYDSVVSGGGKKISVDFPDGETIIGYVLGYSPQRQGFMMTPADIKGNNERIFIINSAVKNINFPYSDQAIPKPEIKEDDRPRVKEKRKNTRVTSINLMSYACFDKANKPAGQGMGKTLDLSLGGLLMETPDPIQAEYILLMAVNLKEELIEIKGKVVYCQESGPNIYHTGIRFIEKNERIREIITDMIKFFSKMKSKSSSVLAANSLAKS